MRVNSTDCNRIPNPCPRPARIPDELKTLVPINRSEIACLGDRIVRQFAPAGLIVGPIRFIIGLAIGIFAAIGAGVAYALGQDKLCETFRFIARRGLDESFRGFYEALVLLISSRDFDRNTQELQGNIRDGEAYGNFMYRGPDGSIAYSQESVNGRVNWHRVHNESWEWRGYAPTIGFAARGKAATESHRIRLANQIRLPEIFI